jgi:hypothetical protein
MPFNTNNTQSKGRPKFSTNKVTTEVREAFNNLLSKNLIQLEADILAIKEPHIRVKLLLELASFCVPKLKSIDQTITATDNIFNPITVTIITEQEYNSIGEKLEKNY